MSRCSASSSHEAREACRGTSCVRTARLHQTCCCQATARATQACLLKRLLGLGARAASQPRSQPGASSRHRAPARLPKAPSSSILDPSRGCRCGLARTEDAAVQPKLPTTAATTTATTVPSRIRTPHESDGAGGASSPKGAGGYCSPLHDARLACLPQVKPPTQPARARARLCASVRGGSGRAVIHGHSAPGCRPARGWRKFPTAFMKQ
jgi:hypothetical protein